MEKEIWKDIEGYEGLYQVSNLGRVRSLNYNQTGKVKVLKLYNKRGYLEVALSKNGGKKFCLVHRLVAQAFIPNPDNFPCVNHKSERKSENQAFNLEWCDHRYNNSYGTRGQRISKALTNGKRSKKVYQYTMGGEFIKVWQSTMEVERQLGFSQPCISKCCLGEQSQSYGYKWYYTPISFESSSSSPTSKEILPFEIFADFPLSIAATICAKEANANNSPTAINTLPSIIHNGGVRNEPIIRETETNKQIRNTRL